MTPQSHSTFLNSSEALCNPLLSSSTCRLPPPEGENIERNVAVIVAPSPRYQRRSSVTRYSLEHVIASPPVPQPTAVVTSSGSEEKDHTTTIATAPKIDNPAYNYSMNSNCTTEDNNLVVNSEGAPPPTPSTTASMTHRRYGRRSSVTRYSLAQQVAPVPETRSLSPVPLARRASLTRITVEKKIVEHVMDPSQQHVNKNYNDHYSSTANLEDNKTTSTMMMEHHPVPDQPPGTDTHGAQAAPPSTRGRYRRRCSVTQYCLEDAATVKASHSADTTSTTTTTIVQVTVQEPMDTIESIEHRQMLANDTIESSGAGDLIVGWSQASADFLESDNKSDDDENAIIHNNNGGDDELICGFGNRLVPVDIAHHTTSSTPSRSENGSSYFLAVLAKKLSKVPFWFKTLESETAVSHSQGGKIDLHSSVGITRAIPIPNPIQ